MHDFGLSLLEQVTQKKEADDLECAMILCSVLDSYNKEYLYILIELSGADRHTQHENIDLVLQQIISEKVVNALFQHTQWLPEYMNYDENSTLAQ